MIAMRRILAAALAAGMVLTGCSNRGAAESGSDIPEATPSVNTPVDPPPTTTQSSDHFDSALEFTRLVYTDKYARAATMVEANSPAARYIAHRMADTKARRIEGGNVSNGEDDWTFDGDKKTGKIKIEPSDGSAGYTWKQFRFDGAGKIRAWTGESGRIESVLGPANRGTAASVRPHG